MKAIVLALTTIVMPIWHTGGYAMERTSIDLELVKVDLTVSDMKQMSDFYEHVFQIKFSPVEMGSFRCFIGQIPNLFTLQLVPKELTGNEAEQNLQQFNFSTKNLDFIIKESLKHGGSQVGDIRHQDGKRIFSVQDPDRNYIVFIGD